MQIDLFFSGADVSAKVSAGEVSPITVEARANIDDDAISFADHAIGGEPAVWRGIRTGANNVGTLAPFTAEFGELLPCNRQKLTFLHARLEILQQRLKPGLGDHGHYFLAFDFIFCFDDLGLAEDLFAIDKLGSGKTTW